MYGIEKVKTNDFGPDGMPIWEVIVRDRNGHAIHHDYCYSCDLDRMVAELENWEEPEPRCAYTIKMDSGGGTVLDFMTLPTLREANEVGNSYGWEFTDENGFVWELYLE